MRQGGENDGENGRERSEGWRKHLMAVWRGGGNKDDNGGGGENGGN